MSDATARPWRWSYEEATGDLVIHGPPYPGKDDACDIVLVDSAYLCGDDAALIVRCVNAHVALVEALEATRHSLIDMDESAYGPQLQYEIGVITAALEAVGSRNGEAKR